MITIIKTSPNSIVKHHTGITRFRSCQCIRDCSCNEDFTPMPYSYYTVTKLINKPKTTRHNTLEEAIERAFYLDSLVNTNNPKWIERRTHNI